MLKLAACNRNHAHADLTQSVSDVLFHYVIVRTDIPTGLMCAMIVHAAGESSPGNLPSDTHAVALAVPSEDALRSVFARLKLAGVPSALIVEDGGTYHGQATAIGVVPAKKGEVHRFLSNLPLIRRQQCWCEDQ